jgi:hypothetical protein
MTNTKTYCIPVTKFRRYKLKPVDLTLIQVALHSLNTKGSHKLLVEAHKKLLKKMENGDFFMVLYSKEPTPKKISEVTSSVKSDGEGGTK